MGREVVVHVGNAFRGPNIILTILLFPLCFVGAAAATDLWARVFWLQIGVVQAALVLYVNGRFDLGRKLVTRVLQSRRGR